MALTRILRGASSSANPFVSVSIAPFVEAYSRAPATGCEPTIALRLMMLPPSAPNRLTASCTVRIAPRSLEALVTIAAFSHSRLIFTIVLDPTLRTLIAMADHVFGSRATDFMEFIPRGWSFAACSIVGEGRGRQVRPRFFDRCNDAP